MARNTYSVATLHLTYPSRQGYQSGENPKRAKDLLYIRDVLAGGAKVLVQVESDLGQLAGAGAMERDLISKARNNLDMTLKGQLYVGAGHLRDALDLLSSDTH